MSIFDSSKYLQRLRLAQENDTITKLLVPDEDGSGTLHPVAYFLDRIDYLDQVLDQDLNDKHLDRISYLLDNNVNNMDILMSFVQSSIQNSDTDDLLARFNELATRVHHRQIGYPELDQLYNDWLRNMHAVKEIERYELEKAEITIEEFSRLKKAGDIDIGVYKTRYFEKEYHPTFNGHPVNVYNGFDIFDAVTCTRNLFFFQYCDSNGKVFTKVFTGENIYESPLYKETIIGLHNLDITTDMEKNTIYFRLFHGNAYDSIQYMTKKMIIDVTYDLNTNTLPMKTIEYGNENESNIKKHLERAIPGFELPPVRSNKISGMFNVYNFPLNYKKFTTLVQTDTVINNILYFKEDTKLQLLKDVFNVRFKELASSYFEDTHTATNHIKTHFDGKFSMKSVLLKTREKVKLITGEAKTFAANTETVEVMFDEVFDEDVPRFMDIIRLVLTYYETRASKVEELVHVYLPGYDLDHNNNMYVADDADDPDDDKRKKKTNKLQALKSFNSDLFDVGFSTACQAGRQPTATHDPELIPEGLTAIEYPTGSGEYFYCDNYETRKIYPGLTKNAKNNNSYSYYPCCFKNDQFEDLSSALNTYLNDGNNTAVYKVDVLKPGVTSSVVKKINNIIVPYFDKHVDLRRYGVRLANNDIIHALCVALGDSKYNDSKRKFDYVDELQIRIANSVNHEVVKQEMYDLSYDDIERFLTNTNVPYYSDLIYRILEEYFDVNIFVFTEKEEKTITSRKQNNEESVEFEIPKHNVFHMRYFDPNRKTVLLYKTYVYDAELYKLYRPHYELLVVEEEDASFRGSSSHRERDAFMFVFPRQFSSYIYELYLKINQNYMFAIEDIEGPTKYPRYSTETKYVNVYLNLLDHINIDYITGGVSQFIDKNGKTRIINTMHYETPVSIFLPPSTPVNLPSSTTFYRIPYSMLPEIIKHEPTAFDIKQGVMYGAFFQIYNLKMGCYIPLEIIKVSQLPDEYYPNVSKRNNNYFNYVVSNEFYHYSSSENGASAMSNKIMNINLIERDNMLKNVWLVFRQFMVWMYCVYKGTVESFMETYFVVDDSRIVDTSVYYKINEVNLPIVHSVEECIAYLKNNEFVRDDGKIVVHNEIFYDVIKNMLLDHVKYNPELKIPSMIAFKYMNQEDFVTRRETLVFVNRPSLIQWVNDKMARTHEVINSINQTEVSLLTNPVVYEDERTGRAFILQNTGNIEQCIRIGHAWLTRLYNDDDNDDRVVSDITADDVNYFVVNDTKTVELVRKGTVNINVLNYNVKNISNLAVLLPLNL